MYHNKPSISKDTKTLKEMAEEITPEKIKNQTLEHNINEHQKLLEYGSHLIRYRVIVDNLIDTCLNSINNNTIEENTKALGEDFRKLSNLVNIKYKLTKTMLNTNGRINELNIIITELNKELHPEDNRHGLKSLSESIRDSLNLLDTE